MKIKKVIIPAGTYTIGDPGQILSDNYWQKICASIDHTTDIIVQKYNDFNFILIGLGGDGMQYDSDHYQYTIDTGSIAIIPEAMIVDDIVKNNLKSSNFSNTRTKTFKNPVQIRFLPYEFMSVGNIFFELGEGEDIDYEYESDEFGHTYWNEWDDDGM
jgi:hypothetical protein